MKVMTGQRLARGVVALGFVSLFMDTSSEMIHSLLPVFLVSVLGASALSVGVIEGIAEGATAAVKMFAGAVSDRSGRRKPLLVLGYGLAMLSKPLFPLATGIGMAFAARLVDRIGKGIRAAPRDALVADITPPALRGAAYGLRQSLDTVGAFLGPALALAVMAASGEDYRLVFWIAVLPAIASVAVLLLAVREPEFSHSAASRHFPICKEEIGRLERRYWLVVAFAAVLTLARFSEAFLLLRAADVGLSAALVPVVLLLMNVVYAASAYPFGRLSDRGGRRLLLAVGIGFLIAADLLLAAADTIGLVAAGAVFWGLHMGATQGLLAAIVAAAAPSNLRGTAFGVFNLVTAGALLAASTVAGALWSAVGPAMTFIAGAGFSAMALIGLLVRRVPAAR
ncbi:MAG: MFS transporter [Gammaproteobacteria bacterium]